MIRARSQAAPRLARRRSITDLAREWGVHRNTARRWLLALDRKHGGRVLVKCTDRRGSKYWTTLSRIREADRRWLEERELRADRLDILEKENADRKNELRTVKRLLREALAQLKA